MKKTTISLVVFFLLFIQNKSALSQADDTLATKDPAQNILLDTAKGNYEGLTLEETQKVLQKKDKLSKYLETQVSIKQKRDEEKRQLLSQIREQDQRNAELLRALREPFKP